MVGDVTIRANRALSVDFSLPYTESGVVMIVKVERDKLKDMWIFLTPLRWDLWLSLIACLIFVGLVLQILERHVQRQWTYGMLFWFPLAALVFPESENKYYIYMFNTVLAYYYNVIKGYLSLDRTTISK